MVLCGGFSAEVRAKKMRQGGSAEFISASLNIENKIDKRDSYHQRGKNML